ncbi:uncharacterized protein [Clytia hemisphaerica]|uniref:Cnidarian restricted protein n=1 Tax=Clytia hemisphaerica TaxID=252671 RepID=A0A7M5V6J5_9CNID
MEDTLRVFVVVVCLFLECNGSYFTDLISTFSLDPSNPPTGAKKVPGPPGGKIEALKFTPDAPPIYLSGPTAANLITTVHNSKDLTFYTEFMMPRALDKDEVWEFFSLQGGSQEILFSIGLMKRSDAGGPIEDGNSAKGNLKQILYISQYIPKQKGSVEHIYIMKDEFKPGQWYKLLVRIRTGGKEVKLDEPANIRVRKRREVEKVEAQIRVNCNEVGRIQLKNGPFDDYVPYGFASFGCILEKQNVSSGLKAARRFPGPMIKTQIINGPLAFKFYSPCDADFDKQEIPSEPLANEYSDAKLKEFLALSAAGSYRTSLTCPETDPTRYRGETWRHPTDSCILYRCSNKTKVVEEWICLECKDPKTKKMYREGEKWIDSEDVCKEHECRRKGFKKYAPRTITCRDPPLTKDDCEGLEPVKLQNECCPKCGNETCSLDRKYYMGCKRTCSDGPDFVCPTKKPGCHCPEGYAENEDRLCIKLGNCPCRSGKIVYQPGQTAVRSSCSTCVCIYGKMKCFSRCYG